MIKLAPGSMNAQSLYLVATAWEVLVRVRSVGVNVT